MWFNNVMVERFRVEGYDARNVNYLRTRVNLNDLKKKIVVERQVKRKNTILAAAAAISVLAVSGFILTL